MGGKQINEGREGGGGGVGRREDGEKGRKICGFQQREDRKWRSKMKREEREGGHITEKE